MGQLADTSQHWVPAFVKLNQLSDKFFDEVWMPERDIGNMRVNLSFTPIVHLHPGRLPPVRRPQGAELLHRTVGADAARAARCAAAAELSAAQGSDAARREPSLGPNGNLVAVGPPLINPNPSLADPNPPLPSVDDARRLRCREPPIPP